MTINVDFPIIQFDRGLSNLQWGQQHGEAYREAIAELVEIRTGLMREKNPQLTTERIQQLANEQWQVTQSEASHLADELSGISQASGVSISDLIVLNNYTDFRDIQPVEDQGCSLVYVHGQTAGTSIGQTWDMHGSAKRYVCVLDIPLPDDHRAIVFSLVGCVGMMGFTTHGTVMGVNNINTDGARPGVLWPVTVRQVLEQTSLDGMVSELTAVKATSGHNYLLADKTRGEMWEVAPGLSECVSKKAAGEEGFLFHTNHCLGVQVAARETKISQNSTTYIRHDLLEKKLPDVKSYEQVYNLMHDHEGYPKAICSNFQTDAQDPSITCGGAAGDLATGKVVMWRGDKIYDDDFIEHEFQLEIR
jgi:isopenicillin-N N-acyltransferase-like protein